MIRRRAFGWTLLGGLAVMATGGCSREERPERLRYQMTIEVETPQGRRTGLAVRELEYFENEKDGFVFGESRPSVNMRGEAIAVNLPDGKVLFALLTGGNGDVDYAKLLPGRALGSRMLNEKVEQIQWRREAELWPYAVKTIGLERTDPLPMLVTFRNLTDPKSVELVDPDNLAASFGQGVKLRRVTIRTTDEPVTSGIEKRLKSMGVDKKHSLAGYFEPTATPTFAQKLSYSDFAREQY
jgi:hypothetical protein